MKKNLCFRVALLSCLVSQDVLWAMPPKGVPENEIVSYAGMPPELREFLVPREGQDVIQKREEDFLKLMLRIGDALRSYGIRNIEFILSPYREETGSWSAWAKPYLMEILSQMDIQTIAVRELDLDLIFGVLFQGFIEHKNSTKLMEIVNPSQGVILSEGELNSNLWNVLEIYFQFTHADKTSQIESDHVCRMTPQEDTGFIELKKKFLSTHMTQLIAELVRRKFVDEHAVYRKGLIKQWALHAMEHLLSHLGEVLASLYGLNQGLGEVTLKDKVPERIKRFAENMVFNMISQCLQFFYQQKELTLASAADGADVEQLGLTIITLDHLKRTDLPIFKNMISHVLFTFFKKTVGAVAYKERYHAAESRRDAVYHQLTFGPLMSVLNGQDPFPWIKLIIQNTEPPLLHVLDEVYKVWTTENLGLSFIETIDGVLLYLGVIASKSESNSKIIGISFLQTATCGPFPWVVDLLHETQDVAALDQAIADHVNQALEDAFPKALLKVLGEVSKGDEIQGVLLNDLFTQMHQAFFIYGPRIVKMIEAEILSDVLGVQMLNTLISALYNLALLCITEWSQKNPGDETYQRALIPSSPGSVAIKKWALRALAQSLDFVLDKKNQVRPEMVAAAVVSLFGGFFQKEHADTLDALEQGAPDDGVLIADNRDAMDYIARSIPRLFKFIQSTLDPYGFAAVEAQKTAFETLERNIRKQFNDRSDLSKRIQTQSQKVKNLLKKVHQARERGLPEDRVSQEVFIKGFNALRHYLEDIEKLNSMINDISMIQDIEMLKNLLKTVTLTLKGSQKKIKSTDVVALQETLRGMVGTLYEDVSFESMEGESTAQKTAAQLHDDVALLWTAFVSVRQATNDASPSAAASPIKDKKPKKAQRSSTRSLSSAQGETPQPQQAESVSAAVPYEMLPYKTIEASLVSSTSHTISVQDLPPQAAPEEVVAAAPVSLEVSLVPQAEDRPVKKSREESKLPVLQISQAPKQAEEKQVLKRPTQVVSAPEKKKELAWPGRSQTPAVPVTQRQTPAASKAPQETVVSHKGKKELAPQGRAPAQPLPAGGTYSRIVSKSIAPVLRLPEPETPQYKILKRGEALPESKPSVAAKKPEDPASTKKPFSWANRVSGVASQVAPLPQVSTPLQVAPSSQAAPPPQVVLPQVEQDKGAELLRLLKANTKPTSALVATQLETTKPAASSSKQGVPRDEAIISSQASIDEKSQTKVVFSFGTVDREGESPVLPQETKQASGPVDPEVKGDSALQSEVTVGLTSPQSLSAKSTLSSESITPPSESRTSQIEGEESLGLAPVPQGENTTLHLAEERPEVVQPEVAAATKGEGELSQGAQESSIKATVSASDGLQNAPLSLQQIYTMPNKKWSDVVFEGYKQAIKGLMITSLASPDTTKGIITEALHRMIFAVWDMTPQNPAWEKQALEYMLVLLKSSLRPDLHHAQGIALIQRYFVNAYHALLSQGVRQDSGEIALPSLLALQGSFLNMPGQGGLFPVPIQSLFATGYFLLNAYGQPVFMLGEGQKWHEKVDIVDLKGKAYPLLRINIVSLISKWMLGKTDANLILLRENILLNFALHSHSAQWEDTLLKRCLNAYVSGHKDNPIKAISLDHLYVLQVYRMLLGQGVQGSDGQAHVPEQVQLHGFINQTFTPINAALETAFMAQVFVLHEEDIYTLMPGVADEALYEPEANPAAMVVDKAFKIYRKKQMVLPKAASQEKPLPPASSDDNPGPGGEDTGQRKSNTGAPRNGTQGGEFPGGVGQTTAGQHDAEEGLMVNEAQAMALKKTPWAYPQNLTANHEQGDESVLILPSNGNHLLFRGRTRGE